MSSILTNNSAMVALQTLKSVNNNLGQTQNEISTGKKVATAKDNSAIWAISKVMESDVAGFKAVSESLGVGKSTVAVASAGAEKIVKIFEEMKTRVVAATIDGADQAKLGAEVQAMKDTITSIIGGSQFNGVNLLNTAGGNIEVLSSIDRAADGTLTPGVITVASVGFEAGLDLTTVNVNTTADAKTSLGALEALLETAVNGAAALGASAKRIEQQSDFVGKLTDAMKSGIGVMVDADMEETSAKLQALQVQQQLATQSLSIANQAPQSILSLFR